jgi:hypothetical protein
MYALHGLDPHTLAIGDSFVLCDAGGGTVDLISYTIIKLQPTLEINEAAAGSGALCGSTFLNRRFGEFLTSKLSRQEGWDAEALAEAIERFESFVSITRIFTINEDSSQDRSRNNTHHQHTLKVATASLFQVSPTTIRSASSEENST